MGYNTILSDVWCRVKPVFLTTLRLGSIFRERGFILVSAITSGLWLLTLGYASRSVSSMQGNWYWTLFFLPCLCFWLNVVYWRDVLIVRRLQTNYQQDMHHISCWNVCVFLVLLVLLSSMSIHCLLHTTTNLGQYPGRLTKQKYSTSFLPTALRLLTSNTIGSLELCVWTRSKKNHRFALVLTLSTNIVILDCLSKCGASCGKW